MAKTLDYMPAENFLEVSWKFTVSPISGPKHAQNLKIFFVKAWNFPGHEKTWVDREDPTSDEDSTAFSLKGRVLNFLVTYFGKNFIHSYGSSFIHSKISNFILLRRKYTMGTYWSGP